MSRIQSYVHAPTDTYGQSYVQNPRQLHNNRLTQTGQEKRFRKVRKGFSHLLRQVGLKAQKTQSQATIKNTNRSTPANNELPAEYARPKSDYKNALDEKIDNPEHFKILSSQEGIPKKTFIFFAYNAEDYRLPIKPDKICLGYAINPKNDHRRTTTPLPGHTTLMAYHAGYKTVNDIIVDLLEEKLQGKYAGGGFIVTDTHVVINPYYSFKSAGCLESSLGYDIAVKYGRKYDLPPLGFFEPCTMNPILNRPKQQDISPEIYSANERMDSQFLPAHLWKPVLEYVSERTGKPIFWEEKLQSDYFKWNAVKKGGAPREQDIADAAEIHSIAYPIVSDVIDTCNKKFTVKNSRFC